MECRLELNDEKLIYKSQQKSGKNETIERGDIELVNWQRLAGTWGIRIFTKSGHNSDQKFYQKGNIPRIFALIIRKNIYFCIK